MRPKVFITSPNCERPRLDSCVISSRADLSAALPLTKMMAEISKRSPLPDTAIMAPTGPDRRCSLMNGMHNTTNMTTKIKIGKAASYMIHRKYSSEMPRSRLDRSPVFCIRITPLSRFRSEELRCACSEALPGKANGHPRRRLTNAHGRCDQGMPRSPSRPIKQAEDGFHHCGEAAFT